MTKRFSEMAVILITYILSSFTWGKNFLLMAAEFNYRNSIYEWLITNLTLK